MFVGFLIADTRMSSIQRGDNIEACDQSLCNVFAAKFDTAFSLGRCFVTIWPYFFVGILKCEANYINATALKN